jgi:2-aminoadipate transaminase
VAPRPVLEKLNLGKQGADLCSSPVTQLFVAAYFGESDRCGQPLWRAYLERLQGLYRARRDVMLDALREHFGQDARWTEPQGGLFIWATLDERIDTTDLLALARNEGVAFVPGRAAYVDGRRGSSSMRLNFAGVPEGDIREGVRRIGAAARDQIGLLGSLSGAASQRRPAEPASGAERGQGAPAGSETQASGQQRGGRRSDAGHTDPQGSDDPQGSEHDPPAGLADVVELPRREGQESSRRRRDR